MSNGEDPKIKLQLKAFDSASEWSKQITTIASATLVLSATFIKDILSGHTTHSCYLWTSWVLFLLTIVGGVFVLGTLTAPLNDGDPSKLNIYSPAIIGAAISQIVLFLLAMVTFILFVTSNSNTASIKSGNSEISPSPSKPPLSGRVTELNDAYFDYGKSAITNDAQQKLGRDAELLNVIYRDFPGAKVVIEGHCDERGAADRNFGLGYSRAVSAREYLGHLGIPPAGLGVATYGKELSVCDQHEERCWQKNRRVHFSILE